MRWAIEFRKFQRQMKVPSFCVLILTALYISGCGGGSKPVSVIAAAASTTVDGGDAVTLTASVANDKNAAGVSWKLTGAGTLSNASTTGATYTAPAATASSQSVTITATSLTDASKSSSVAITIPAQPSISTSSLSAATVGTAYSATLTGAGGITPYKWSLSSGTLPSSLSLASGGTLSGTPMATDTGTYTLTFKLTDSGTATALTATENLTLTVNAAPAISFTGTVPTTATLSVAYSGSAAASGGAGALSYSISTGALPTGLLLNASSGALSGTPTAVGTFAFTVKAADAFGDSKTQSYSVKVSYPPVTVASVSLPTGYLGSNYTATTLTVTGGSGSGYTWALQSGSSLPAGLALSQGGVISGKPTGSAGTTSFTVVVTDSASNQGTASLSIAVKTGVSFSTTSPLPTGYVGSNYSQQFAATGGSGSGYTFAVTSGSSLPGGLSLSTAGLLNGKPATAGTPSFSVTATDSAGNTATTAFLMTIAAGISISAITLPSGYQGSVYPGATFSASGGTGTGYTWTWTAAPGSSLPAGLNLSAVGAVTGTPTGSGTFSVVVTVTDSVGNTASGTFSLTIEAQLHVTTSSLASATVNVAYSQTLAASGGSGTGYTWSVDTAGATSLAAINLTLSSGGTLAGTPLSTGSATFTATVTDSASHTASATLTVTVYASLTVTTSSLPSTNVGVAYSQSLAAAGGTGTGYTWSVTSGATSLSAVGLSVSSGGIVSGTPTAAGTASFTVQVKDSASSTATASLSVQVYGALSLEPASSTVPGPGTTGGAYVGIVTASGGSGSYAWTITGLPTDGLSGSTTGGTLSITGTPTSATTVSFAAKVTDTATNNSVGPNSYSIVVSNPSPLVLPSSNPGSLPAATVNQSYSGSITATGGVAPYTWAINGVTVPSNGSQVALSDGLSASNTGGATLAVSGTPTSTGTVTLTNVTITDHASTVAGPDTYSVTVNSAGSQVSGQISLVNFCGNSSTLPTFSVQIAGTGFNQTTTTDSNGNYSFATVPNGSYTITPSITGASSVFYPATENVTVNNGAISGQNFNVSLGYTVSGSVSYSGSTTGRIYLNLVNSNCGGSGGNGTSIASTGSFSIHGVAPGSYTLKAWMDPSSLADETPNEADPAGNVSVSVSTANATGANVTLANPTLTTPTPSPNLKSVAPTDSGVVISYGGGSVLDNNGVEEFSSYTVEWSTSSSFTSTSSLTLKASATSNVWIVNNSVNGISGSFSNGSAYYFRVRGSNSAGNGPWAVWGGSTPTAVTVGVPSGSGYHTVTGTVVIPSSVTVATGAQLYTGYYDQSTNTAYAARIGAPNNSSGGNAFSVEVPTGSYYIQFAILDQNNDGLIDGGDVTNVFGNNSNIVSVSGNLTNQNLTLPSSNSNATVQTQFAQSTFSNGSGTSTSTAYSLNLQLREQNKLPVAVELTAASDPNILTPLDISNYCQGCGNLAFQYYASIGSDVPAVNDTYTFNVTYSDGTSGTVTGTVTAVLGASNLATNLAPTTGSSTSVTPTFTWTDPANASNYIYQFYMNDSNGNTIWQIPSNGSNLSGFSSTITSITWGTDPTGDSSNTPSVSSLTGGATYNWSIQAQDANGNSATQQVQYQP